MKKHLDGRRGRETAASTQVGVVVLNPLPNQKAHGPAPSHENGDLSQRTESSLQHETTEHLSRLSQRLSNDNEALLSLVRGTLATLRSLQGLPEDPGGKADWWNEDLQGHVQGFLSGSPSCEALAANTDDVLEHLRELLTNPSFVPLEEVVVRDDEISRLREGWEMMAVRWKEAVTLMDGWKRRMVDEGDTINLEDLKHGLKLGSGIPTAQESRLSPAKMADVSLASDVPEASPNDAKGPVDGSPSYLSPADSARSIRSPSRGENQALREVNPNVRRAMAVYDSSCSPINENIESSAVEDRVSASGLSVKRTANKSPHTRLKPRVPVQVCNSLFSQTSKS